MIGQKKQNQMAEAYIKLLQKITDTTESFNGSMIAAIASHERVVMKSHQIDAEIKGKQKLKKVDEQLIRLRHVLKVDLEDHHHRQVRRNIAMRDNHATLDKSFGFITKTMTGGFGFQAGLGAVVKAVAKSTVTFNALEISAARLKKADENLAVAQDNLKNAASPDDKRMMEGELKLAQKEQKMSSEEHEDNSQKTGGNISQKKGFGSMFKGLNKIGGIVKKGAMPIGIGMGVAGIIMSIITKALGASPLFQQIMKMMKFSVNLILMPIGTFFGAILRPILITLLRKLIIPMYSKWMPIMMTLGTSIGEGVVSFFDILEKEGLGSAMASLFKGVDVGAIIWDALAKTLPVFVAADFIAGLFKWGDGTDANGLGFAVNEWFTKGLAEATASWDNFFTDYQTWVRSGISGATAKWDELYTNYKTWVTTGIAGISNKFSEIWDSIITWFTGSLTEISYAASVMFGVISGWFATGLSKAQTTFTGIWDNIISWFTKGINSVSIAWNDLFDAIKNAVLGGITGGGNSDYDSQGYHKADTNQSGYMSSKEASDWNWNPLNLGKAQVQKGSYDKVFGSGGIINEPISGIGMNSGQSYLMGESGSEMVTPMNGKSGSGGTITINIQNMNGSDDDLRKLKKTILDVLQDSSTSRGRI